jgi:hypothetical protein
MFEVGDRFDIVQGGFGTEYRIININKENEKKPYECYPMSVVRKAFEISRACNINFVDIILNSEHSEEFLKERRCFSESDIAEYLKKQKKREEECDVEYYKSFVRSLIEAIDEHITDYDEKIEFFVNTFLPAESFRKLGYDSLANAIREAEVK